MRKLTLSIALVLFCTIPQQYLEAKSEPKSFSSRIKNSCSTYLENHFDLRFVNKKQGQGLNIQLLEPSRWSHRILNSLFNYFFGPKLGLREYEKILEELHQDNSSDNIFVKYQKAFGSSYYLTQNSLPDIPKEGPLIIVANHPGAGWEIFSIVEFILKTRSDFKILANEVLASIPGLGEFFIPVPIFKRRVNSALIEAESHLKNKGVLVIFPSGEVSSHVIGQQENGQPTIVDGPWLSALSKVIKSTQPAIVPIFVDTRPTDNWLRAREEMTSDTMRVLNHFGAEVFSHRGEELPLTIGRSVPASIYVDEVGLRNLFPTLRRATYFLGGINLPDQLPNQVERIKEHDADINREGAKLWLP